MRSSSECTRTPPSQMPAAMTHVGKLAKPLVLDDDGPFVAEVRGER